MSSNPEIKKQEKPKGPDRLPSILCLAGVVAVGLAPGLASANASPAETRPTTDEPKIEFVGGTPAEQEAVRGALRVSKFNWADILPATTVHIEEAPDNQSLRGAIWLKPSLLKGGKKSWGIVLHEFGHQLIWKYFDSGIKRDITKKLGGRAWSQSDQPGLDHSAYTEERFASTLAWTYWQSPDNILKPKSPESESAAMKPVKFKQLMNTIFSKFGLQAERRSALPSQYQIDPDIVVALNTNFDEKVR